MTQLILIRGLPGSGKTTLARKLYNSMLRFDENIFHYEADMYFETIAGEYNFDASKLGNAHEWCQSMTKHRLSEGSDVIVSNTFTTSKELRPYFQIAHELGIVPTVFLCQNRFQSVHNVPEDTLRKMHARFEYNIDSLYAMFV